MSTGKKAGSKASRVLSSSTSLKGEKSVAASDLAQAKKGGHGLSGKVAAGSALSQKPVTKRGSISSSQASSATRSYLSSKKK